MLEKELEKNKKSRKKYPPQEIKHREKMVSKLKEAFVQVKNRSEGLESEPEQRIVTLTELKT